MNNFPGLPLHNLSKLYNVPFGFVPPPPLYLSKSIYLSPSQCDGQLYPSNEDMGVTGVTMDVCPSVSLSVCLWKTGPQTISQFPLDIKWWNFPNFVPFREIIPFPFDIRGSVKNQWELLNTRQTFDSMGRLCLLSIDITLNHRIIPNYPTYL